MILEDWHTHNYMSRHAVGTLKDYVNKAIEMNLNVIGLSDHFPYELYKNIENIPYQEYSMTLQEVENYLATAERLREINKDKIEVKIGFELEFMVSQIAALNNHLNGYLNRLDYLLGSIHILKGAKGLWPLDDKRYMSEYESYGVEQVFLQYYQALLRMVNSVEFTFDIISHFDLPKKFTNPPKSEILSDAILKTLEAIKQRNKVMEINTSGFRRKAQQQFPSDEIIKIMYQLDIPILLGSDAHDPDLIAYEFKKMIPKLKDIGYNQLVNFTKRKYVFFEI